VKATCYEYYLANLSAAVQQAVRQHVRCAASCHHWLRDVIGHVTIRLSTDDFIYVLYRNQTHILITFRDIYYNATTSSSMTNIDKMIKFITALQF